MQKEKIETTKIRLQDIRGDLGINNRQKLEAEKRIDETEDCKKKKEHFEMVVSDLILELDMKFAFLGT